MQAESLGGATAALMHCILGWRHKHSTHAFHSTPCSSAAVHRWRSSLQETPRHAWPASLVTHATAIILSTRYIVTFLLSPKSYPSTVMFLNNFIARRYSAVETFTVLVQSLTGPMVLTGLYSDQPIHIGLHLF